MEYILVCCCSVSPVGPWDAVEGVVLPDELMDSTSPSSVQVNNCVILVSGVGVSGSPRWLSFLLVFGLLPLLLSPLPGAGLPVRRLCPGVLVPRPQGEQPPGGEGG